MTEDKLRTELEPLLAELREDLKRIDYGGIHVGHERHILRAHIKKAADTIEGLLLRIESLTEAGDKLSVAAQTTGGAAGHDKGLVAAIDAWAALR